MARYEFGKGLDDPDVLVIQGVEYEMQPLGMRVMRSVLAKRQLLVAQTADPARQAEASNELIELMQELIVSAVAPAKREQLREQIEESVPVTLIAQIAGHLLGSFSDLNPTQPGSSSNGSSPTGQSSTDGVARVVSTPAISRSAG